MRSKQNSPEIDRGDKATAILISLIVAIVLVITYLLWRGS